MIEQELQNSFKELMKLVKASIEAFGKYTKAKATGTTGDELAKLESAKTESRASFDKKLSKVIGDISAREGKERSRQWGFNVQLSYVMGLVNSNAFRYVEPRNAEILRLTAESYVQGHKVLGWEPEHGVNPRSVQTLAGALEKALVKAREEGDPHCVQQIIATLSGLKRHAAGLLKKKEERKPEGFSLGQALGYEKARPEMLAATTASAAPATPEPTAPEETPPANRKSRRSR